MMVRNEADIIEASVRHNLCCLDRLVVIDHGSFSTRYAHLSKIDVKPGDTVQQGQVIAQSGATGRVTGAHLHFEVLEAGQSVNPAAILPTYAAGGSQERN